MARKKKVSIETPDTETVKGPEVDETEKAASEAAPVEAEVIEPDDVDEAETDTDDEVEAEKTVEEDVLAKAVAEAGEFKDRYLRLQAEWDNFRKRSQAERETERIRASEKLVTNLLPVIDDFERAIAHAKESPDAETLLAGIEAVHTKFIAVLQKEKVEIIDPIDEAFDAMKHQAVGKVEDDSVPDETVKEVYQKGYEMGGRVIRPAMVTVSSGGAPREPQETE